jgi:hypothetical protein
MRKNVAPILSDLAFQQNGLLVIAFDESNSSDSAYGGGRIAVAVVGPKVKRGYKGTNFYQHQSLLRMTAESLGLTSFPGAAANASNMGSFFGSRGSSACVINTADHSVTICRPDAGGTYSSPVYVVAEARSSTGVKTTALYLDNVREYSNSGNKVDRYVSMAPGTHRITVQSWDPNNLVFKSSIYITVK